MAATQHIELGNSILALKRDLHLRLTAPVGQFSFWVYIALGILAFGGAAVWVELYKYATVPATNSDGIRTAIGTYFPAIGCAAALQLAYAEDEKKHLRSFGWIVSFAFVVWSFWLLRAGVPTSASSFLSGIAASLLAILMWWIANALDETFHDKVNLDAPLGGSANAPPLGNTSGFRT